jgi:hypothetical protein
MKTIGQERQVDVPEGMSGNVEVKKFTVGEGDMIRQIRDIFSGRAVPPGTYTKLLRNGRLWMSDTPAEWYDNFEAFYRMQRHGGRVLVNGLGLGMIVKAALTLPNVEHIDVVEIDEDVINLVGPTYDDPRVTIHHADAYEQMKRWPRGSKWSVAWHDIWCGA